MTRVQHAAGFTLVELMTVLAIVAVLLTLAVPSLRDLILNQHVKTAASDIQTALYYGRSEAIKRATDVAVAPVSGDWKNGWTVKAGTTLLRQHNALDSSLDTMATAGVTYQASGRTTAAPATIVARVAGNDKVTARCVVVDLSGRPSAVVDADGDPSNGCQ
jgi:type IV fimbrial biogenesis protein FimT